MDMDSGSFGMVTVAYALLTVLSLAAAILDSFSRDSLWNVSTLVYCLMFLAFAFMLRLSIKRDSRGIPQSLAKSVPWSLLLWIGIIVLAFFCIHTAHVLLYWQYPT